MHKSAVIEIDLNKIAENYQILKDRYTGRHLAAVVKANAYGLGAAEVSRKLYEKGARIFFVATFDEALEVNKTLSEIFLHTDPTATKTPNTYEIFVLNGIFSGELKEFKEHKIRPIINSPAQLELIDNDTACAIHVDTGMHRLGFSENEFAKADLKNRNIKFIMSHLACAGESLWHEKNEIQLKRFNEITRDLDCKKSLCNSKGVFMDKEYHFDIARPGCALYGIYPNAEVDILKNVVSFTAPIIQYHVMERDGTTGYGATHEAKKGDIIATVSAGYADGIHRILSNSTQAVFYADRPIKIPLIGRVTMDLISFDVTEIPEKYRRLDAKIELIGKHHNVNKVAGDAHTIGYEVFTSIGNRIKRIYL